MSSGLPPPHAPQQQQQQQQRDPSFEPRRAPMLSDPYAGTPSASNMTTPQSSQYSPALSLPGSLQPGGTQQQLQQQQQRPAVLSQAYTAPSAIPQIPQINTNTTNLQQYTLPTRSNTHQTQSQPPQQPSSHSYSRSSPAGLGPDQKYIPFSSNTTPENPKYQQAPPPQKYYPTTPSGAASNSPLGLADIRPRALSTMNEDTMPGNFFNEIDRVPSNSNYVTPWPAYAFDWCKWNVPGGNSAGKMAVGSFLEDTHNFVRTFALEPVSMR
jgi:WD repeat-containing protein 68